MFKSVSENSKGDLRSDVSAGSETRAERAGARAERGFLNGSTANSTSGVTAPPLTIAQPVFEHIHRAARKARGLEIMGLLARANGLRDVVTAGFLLRAEASSGHAEAAPLEIGRAARSLFSQSLHPAGFWHSHGNHPVCHSGTDERTIEAFLPAMAPCNFRRESLLQSPTVIDVDRAVLPLPDGRHLGYTLLGPELPDGQGYERLQWGQIQTSFCDRRQDPQATQRPGQLVLSAGRVTLSLGVPEGATLLSRIEDPAPRRTAYIYSLVVNGRREACAVALVVHDYQGEIAMQKVDCEIRVVDTPSGCEAVWQDGERTVRLGWCGVTGR